MDCSDSGGMVSERVTCVIQSSDSNQESEVISGPEGLDTSGCNNDQAEGKTSRNYVSIAWK